MLIDLQAKQTWVLKRRHRVADLTAPQWLDFMNKVSNLRYGEGWIGYRQQYATVRPAAAVMLKALLSASQASLSVAAICEQLYGRPASLRALRQSAYRVNRAMEDVDCPLTVHCRDACVYLRPRKLWPWELRGQRSVNFA